MPSDPSPSTQPSTRPSAPARHIPNPADSLDFAFLRYFNVTTDGEGRVHNHYLPMLKPYNRVLDLGCGMGGFVKLLLAQGNDAYGVDSDPGCIETCRSHNLPVVEADVVDYLNHVEPGSLDAIFSAHLVEHLPYQVTLDVIRLAHQALRPGGRLLLVTPNPRAPISHLEMYHLHFGHIAFYPADLLGFFMKHVGFDIIHLGENPDTTARRLLPTVEVSRVAQAADVGEGPSLLPMNPRAVLPPPRNPLRWAIWAVKMGLIHWLVQPFTDRLTDNQRLLLGQGTGHAQALNAFAELMDRSFECYAIGDK